jgi:hypothetical protein
MHMFVIYIVSFLLAGLPLVIAIYFLIFTLPRKVLAITQDVNKLAGTGASGSGSGPTLTAQSRSYTPPDIGSLAKKYFGGSTLGIPSTLLTGLYFAGFLLCDSYIRLHYVDNSSPWLFPRQFVDSTVLLLYAFVGVYIFNLGDMIRRLYLADVSEQVFWGAINRLLLSMGLALVILKSGLNWGAEFYFTIGFLANIVLDWLLERALKLLNMAQPKQDDLPLQMVKGINIWKEYRLEEEGIENVQNLATADAVDLAVRTHYSARTLIDWIDQAIVLARLTSDQVKAMTSQAMAISAIELATAAPENNNGDKTFANALAAKLNVDPVLMAATLDRLYEDEYVRILWELWQSGTETATSNQARIKLPSPQVKTADTVKEPAPPLATGAAAGATGGGTASADPAKQ